MARLVLSKPLAVKTGHGLAAQPLSRLPLLLALLVASCRSPPVPCACALSQLGRGAIQRHARLVARTRSHGGCNYLKGSWVDTSTIPGYSPPYSPSCSQFSCADVAEGHTNPSSFVWQPFPPCSYDLWRMQPRVLLDRYRNSVIAFVGDSFSDNLVYSFRCTLSAATPFKYVRLSVGNYRYRNALLLPSYNLTIVSIGSGKLTRLVNTNFMSPVLKLRKSLKAVRDYIERTNYPGVPLVVSYSPMHYRVQCRKAVAPSNNITAAVEGGDLRAMVALKEQRKLLKNSQIRLVEITYMSMLRPDAHLNRGLNGRKKDCSHWCLPGVPDAWVDVIYSMLV